MAKTSNTSIGVTVSGDGIENTYVPRGSPVENTSAPQGGPVRLSLSAGNNSITIPTGAIGAVFSPPTTSTNVKIVKGVNGDTGVTVRNADPFMLTFGAGATLVINSVGSEDLDVQWI